MSPALAARRASAVFAIASALSVAVLAQAPTSQNQQIVIGATPAQRHEAARTLVPLLSEVKEHAQPGVTIKPGSLPNSPVTGRSSTLFAFTISRRSVPVDPRVVKALDQLLAWEVGATGTGETSALFDRWLVELQARSTSALAASGVGLCDVNCIVQRMTTLDERWGASPKGRGDARDELLLDALTAAVLTEK